MATTAPVADAVEPMGSAAMEPAHVADSPVTFPTADYTMELVSSPLGPQTPPAVTATNVTEAAEIAQAAKLKYWQAESALRNIRRAEASIDQNGRGSPPLANPFFKGAGA